MLKTMEEILKELLKEAHEKMDDLNAEGLDNRCLFCGVQGYDSNGMLHDDDCILVRMRNLL